jgi:hypothetical protein
LSPLKDEGLIAAASRPVGGDAAKPAEKKGVAEAKPSPVLSGVKPVPAAAKASS